VTDSACYSVTRYLSMARQIGLTPSLSAEYLRRYQAGEWRGSLFADIILRELSGRDGSCTVVDIGCGGGFDGSKELQEKIAARSGEYVGIEPDEAAELGAYFSRVHRTTLERAPIEEASVDLAFCVMVVEHVSDPAAFMAKVSHILRRGGVFWAFTIDLRHWSAWCSLLLERLSAKGRYLDALHGPRGLERYNNYPVQYRLNTPKQVESVGGGFTNIDFLPLMKVGAEDYNLPPILRPLNHALDRALSFVGAPGSNLAFRMVRGDRP
jgi:SAM-dependent methyltransferase